MRRFKNLEEAEIEYTEMNKHYQVKVNLLKEEIRLLREFINRKEKENEKITPSIITR